MTPPARLRFHRHHPLGDHYRAVTGALSGGLAPEDKLHLASEYWADSMDNLYRQITE